MMNGSFLVGCLSPGYFAHSLGVLNMLVTAAFCCTTLVFAMIGLTSIPSLMFISVLFGYFFGLCKCFKINKRFRLFTFLTSSYFFQSHLSKYRSFQFSHSMYLNLGKSWCLSSLKMSNTRLIFSVVNSTRIGMTFAISGMFNQSLWVN